MAFRNKAEIGALIILAAGIRLAAADSPAYRVRHRHTPGGAPGVLRVSADGIAFEESGQYRSHSRQWRFQDIEQLTLSPASLRVLTYEDRGWKLGGRQFVFDRLPEGFAAQLYPILSSRLDRRFVAALADAPAKTRWETPVKLQHWRGGAQGTLLVSSDRVVFKTESPEQSRTWRLGDIDNVSSSDPFDLTVTTFERAGASDAGRRDFHFQLKRPMAESDYDALWRDVNLAKGLQILSSFVSQGDKQ